MRGVRPFKAQGDVATQSGVTGIAKRRDRRKTVERAAQDDDDQAGIASASRKSKAGKKCCAKHCAPGEHGGAARKLGLMHDWLHRVQRRWNSGDINARARPC